MKFYKVIKFEIFRSPIPLIVDAKFLSTINLFVSLKYRKLRKENSYFVTNGEETSKKRKYHGKEHSLNKIQDILVLERSLSIDRKQYAHRNN